jgi:hypothetical protein
MMTNKMNCIPLKLNTAARNSPNDENALPEMTFSTPV